MADTGAPGTRACTLDFKIRVIGRWLRQHGASRTNPVTVAVGFSTDACLNRRTSALATARADLSLRALRARSTVPSTLSPPPDVTERAAISTWGMTPMCLLEDFELDARLARSVSGSLTA
jgi:hypothetical protein